MDKDNTPPVIAIVARLQKISAELPGAEEYTMVHHPAFRVGKKPFAIAGMMQGNERATLSINLGLEMQHQLLDDTRFSKTRYIGQHGWVMVAPTDLKPGEFEALVIGSWHRVANKKQRTAYESVRAKPAQNVKKESAPVAHRGKVR